MHLIQTRFAAATDRDKRERVLKFAIAKEEKVSQRRGCQSWALPPLDHSQPPMRVCHQSLGNPGPDPVQPTLDSLKTMAIFKAELVH